MLGFQVMISNHVCLLPQQEAGQAERIELMWTEPSITGVDVTLTHLDPDLSPSRRPEYSGSIK